MMTKGLWRPVLFLTACAALLAGCGGGGSGGGLAANPTAPPTPNPTFELTLTVDPATLPVDPTGQFRARGAVTARLTRDGQPVNGATIDLAVSPSTVAALIAVDDESEVPELFTALQRSTISGVVALGYVSLDREGTATISASTVLDNGATISDEVQVQIAGFIEDPVPAEPELSLTVGADTLPADPSGLNRARTDVTVTLRDGDGQPINGATVDIAVTPITRGGLFDENAAAAGQNPFFSALQRDTVSGTVALEFFSGREQGIATISASAVVELDDGTTVTVSDVDEVRVEGELPPPALDELALVLTPRDASVSRNDTPAVFGPDSEFATAVQIELFDVSDSTQPARPVFLRPDPENPTPLLVSVADQTLGLLSTVGTLSDRRPELTLEAFNGTATVVFHAGSALGSAEVRASLPFVDGTVVGSTRVQVDDSTQVPRPTVSVSAQDATLSANPGTIIFSPGSDFATQLTIDVRDEGGAPVDGVPVRLAVEPGEAGLLSLPGAAIGDGNADIRANSVELTTVNGVATAVFYTQGATGQARIVASADFGEPFGRVGGELAITIDDAVSPPERVGLEATRTRLPANAFFVPIFLGSPYIAEVTLTYRDRFGVLRSPTDAEFAASIDPVTIAAFSTLDDPETEDINEFLVLVGNAPVQSAAGTATVFVHSFDIPGTATLRVTAQDPDSGEIFENAIDFQIVEPASDGAPANVIVNASTGLLFVQDSGGQTAQQVEVLVFDGANEPVADPTDNNNVRVEVVSQDATGVVLSALNVDGTQVEGQAISVATTAGATSVSLRTGTEPGFVRLRAIADAADNNVDNGITAPVTDVFELEITDGEPFAVSVSAFQLGQQGINPVNDGVRLTNADPNFPVPTVANGVYQLPVLAVVTDRQGNPPARPVTVQFGLIDAPVEGFPATGPGTFPLSGGDGNPREGATLFTAPGGAFTTAGGGARPGDTLVLFGRDSVGNADLEGSRIVDQILSGTQLEVTRAFNLNEGSGGSADRGPTVPYALGRPQTGNVVAAAVTDEFGVAATTLTYPVSALGRSVVLWAQVVTSEDFSTLGDVSQGTFSGLAPLQLIVSPDDVYANQARELRVCTYDATGVPIPGVRPFFSFGTHVGTARVDGQEDIGFVATPTGFDGCTLATVETTGVPISGTGDFDFVLTFEAGLVAVPVTIDGSISDQNPIAQIDVLPEAFIGDTLGTDILVRLTDVNGVPQPGLNIDVDCSSSQGIITPLANPGVTDENGEVIVRIATSGLDALCPGDPVGVGVCVIDTTAITANGDTVEVVGREGFLLPDDPFCTGTEDEVTLTVDFFEFSPGCNNPLGPDGFDEECLPGPGAPPRAGGVGTDGLTLNSVLVLSNDGTIACEYNVANSEGPEGECQQTYFEGTPVDLSIQLGNVPFCRDAEFTNDADPDNDIVYEGCFIGWAGTEECNGAVDVDGFPLTTVRMIVDTDMACTARFR